MNKIFLIICILNLYLGEYERMNQNLNIKNETIYSLLQQIQTKIINF